ncbi:transmembrane protein 54-like isoform X2 [Betta splendens]|nr:transmembrane protein 54-like isoform X2 [Betta splendens]
MKMGLSVVCVGHVNFLLGALVHGVVLRHIGLSERAGVAQVVASNVLALVTGLIGIVVGVLAIILSKNKKNRGLTWSLFAGSLAAAVTAAASAVGLLVSVAMSIRQRGRSLLTSCAGSDASGYSSCPFDPTLLNRTTLILWVPLVGTCVIQMVFSSRCFAACLSFLGLSCRPKSNRRQHYGRAINVVRPLEVATSAIEPPRSHAEPPTRSAEPSKSDHHLPRWNSAPPRQQRLPPALSHYTPRQHQSLPPSERRPLRQSYRERSHRQRPETGTGSPQRAPEQHHLLERATMERSSFWV